MLKHMKGILQKILKGAGYTPVPHILVENVLMKYNFKSYETRMLWFIYRNSFGWQRLVFHTTQMKISEATRLSLAHVGRTLKALERYRIIAIEKHKQDLTIQFNMDYMTYNLKDVDNLFSAQGSSSGSSSRGNVLLPNEASKKTPSGTLSEEERKEMLHKIKEFNANLSQK